MSRGYAELHCLSNFTFLRGASHPEELVEQADELGYRALAITDECSVAGVVRAWQAARERSIDLIVGSEIRLADGMRCVLLATDREGYGQLCALVARGRRRVEKGAYRLDSEDLGTGLDRCLALWLPGAVPREEELCLLRRCFPDRLWIAVELFAAADDRRRLGCLETLGRRHGVPRVASGDVHMHRRGRRALQDTLTAIRLGVPVGQAGRALYPNGERHLRPLASLQAIYPPSLLEASLEIAGRCRFDLGELRYEYPAELVPEGHTPASWLRELTEQGIRRRWPGGADDGVRAAIEHELALIRDLSYEPFFLTVQDIVSFARRRGILCQGRGSAANSAVCFALGITEVDPARMSVLFERFISKERNE
ncbi:MAG: PHP domain-containing protein, partial [Gammaproteobacteria bacterium]